MLARIDDVVKASGLVVPAIEPAYEAPRQWHILVTAPHKEREAADWLKRAHKAVYFPNYQRRVVNRKGLRRSVWVAVIPGYLFLPVTPGEQPSGIVDVIPGILAILLTGEGKPAVLREEGIHTIRRIEAALNLPQEVQKHHSFKVGDRVRFKNDRYLGWQGPIVRLASGGRIGVEVTMFGRKVVIDTAPPEIEKM